ncbi:hypothetical protein Patl1_20957 [Pistacia atlantica]|uniref:Uncharacterized protein n=1 Tax=Pistacia atlantica TaxID=434234 RepID=A0ACC1BKY8_9ROSI|nr:hypothetical protein Patl1_20957 [Pistacia atlantica]
MVAVVWTKSGNYVVSIFVEAHNHSLRTPRKVHLLRSHRNVLVAQKALTQKFSAANVPMHRQFSTLYIG